MSLDKAKLTVEIVDVIVRVWSTLADRREREKERQRKQEQLEREVADLRGEVERLRKKREKGGR
jgi:hypothetical protein